MCGIGKWGVTSLSCPKLSESEKLLGPYLSALMNCPEFSRSAVYHVGSVLNGTIRHGREQWSWSHLFPLDLSPLWVPPQEVFFLFVLFFPGIIWMDYPGHPRISAKDYILRSLLALPLYLPLVSETDRLRRDGGIIITASPTFLPKWTQKLKTTVDPPESTNRNQ